MKRLMILTAAALLLPCTAGCGCLSQWFNRGDRCCDPCGTTTYATPGCGSCGSCSSCGGGTTFSGPVVTEGATIAPQTIPGPQYQN